jgi:RimJ/RimL family protein N-acetyltransferase
MIEPLYGADEWVTQWVSSQIEPVGRDFGPCKAIGWVDGETLIAGTVLHNYSPEAGVIELSSASIDPRWLTRRVLNTMFRAVFEANHCQLAVMRVSERNKRMCSIARRFGFASVLIPRLRGIDEGEFIFTLTVEQWMSHSMRVPDGQEDSERSVSH